MPPKKKAAKEENKEIVFNFEDVDNTLPDVSVEEPELKAEAARKPVNEEAELKAKKEEAEKVEKEKEKQQAEYLIIYDAIMFEDSYKKTYKLGKKYSATFATRSADDDLTISKYLDSLEFSTLHAMQTMSALLTLSYSLVELNGKDLSKMEQSDRYDFIRGKSSHLIEALSSHMIEFDVLVRDAIRYGEENF